MSYKGKIHVGRDGARLESVRLFNIMYTKSGREASNPPPYTMSTIKYTAEGGWE